MALVSINVYDITNTPNRCGSQQPSPALRLRIICGFWILRNCRADGRAAARAHASHANEAIKTLNRFTRDTFGLGGIFHGAVEVNGEEWSFGYCPYGTGVSAMAVRRRRLARLLSGLKGVQ